MLKTERLALELLEYKLADLLAKRQPPGGLGDALALYQYLIGVMNTLSPEERHRFYKAGRQLKEIRGYPGSERRVIKALDQLDLSAGVMALDSSADEDDPPAPEDRLSDAEKRERKHLQELARRVWWGEIESVIERFAVAYRAERDRHTVRIIYAAIRNLEHYSRSATFAKDVNLSHFQVQEGVPQLSDPLLSFHDLSSIAELIRDVIETAFSFKAPRSPYRKLSLPESQVLNYLRRVAKAVARDPYAGKLSLMPRTGANSHQMRLALQELSREQIPDEVKQQQRQQFEARLEEALELERTQRRMLQQDIQLFSQAADDFFDKLAAYLPRRVGGNADDPKLTGGVLFAENPALRIDDVPEDMPAVTVHLRGALRLMLAGVEVAIAKSPSGWTVYLGEHEKPLGEGAQIRFGRRRLLAYRVSDYAHLRIQDETRSLAALVAEALAVHYVLQDTQGKYLKILKTATGVAGGEPQETIKQAIRRLGRLIVKVPDKRRAIGGFVQGAARALHISMRADEVSELVEQLYRALSVDAGGLSVLLHEAEEQSGGQSMRYPLTGEPINVQFEDQPMTARKYHLDGRREREGMVVMIPGRPSLSFDEYALMQLTRGTLLWVRADDELAVLYLPHEQARAQA